MKKWSLILILITSLLSLSACAAVPNPQPEAQAETQEQMTEEQQEALEEAQEAQREALEEAEEAQREAMEDAREAQEDAREAMQEAHTGWQEGMEEARKGLIEAHKQLKKSNINIALPNFAGSAFGMSMIGSPAQKTESVMLIPDKPMDTKIMGQLTEDMQVMALILEEKASGEQPVSQNGSDSYGGGYSSGWMTFKVFGSCPTGIKTIYLGGYGILFTLDVDFPLVLIKGAEEKPQAPETEKKDEVWHRSKSKLKGQDKPADEEKDKAPALVFDPDKVKQLQKDLTAALKHAANIRHLEPREKVVIAVRSVIDDQALTRQITDTDETTDKEPVSVPTSVMIIQAAKQDIDAFAADKIDEEKFTGKVSVITY